MSVTSILPGPISQLNPRSRFAKSYRKIKANIEFFTMSGNMKSILVTSSRRGDGKTSTAANLGVVFANSDKRILLLDADLRSPQLHHRFRVRGDLGLSQALRQEEKLYEAIVQTDVKGLSLLPGGEATSDATTLLSSHSFTSILNKLQSRYDLVIVDSPPVLEVSDGLIIAHSVDGIVFVVDAKTTNRIMAQRGISAIRQVNGKVLGGVLNRTPKNHSFNEYIYGSVYGLTESQKYSQ